MFSVAKAASTADDDSFPIHLNIAGMPSSKPGENFAQSNFQQCCSEEKARHSHHETIPPAQTAE